MQSGELVVTGTDKISIPLQKNPGKVDVKFKHALDSVPCNPHHADLIEHEIQGGTGSDPLILVISWSVSTVREVVWNVYY